MNRLSFFLILLVFAGCALHSDYHQGRRSLNKGNYDEAIALFQRALETSPDNARVLTDLGVAYYKQGDFEKAIPYLENAKYVDPMYGMSYFYLGLIYESQNEFQKAISEYSAYYQKAPLTPLGRRLKAYMGAVIRRQIQSEVEMAIQQEKAISPDSIPENTIAVSYFSNLTGSGEFNVLQKGLADMVITDLSQVGSLRIVERTRLQLLVDELKLSQFELVDSSTAPRLGRLLGARRIVNGGIALPQAEMFRIDAIATDVATAEMDARADAMGDQDRFFLMEKELVFGILDDLNVSITQEERDAIQKFPTESFLAFLAYCRGLDYEDRGMYREAAEAFREAAKIDPGFSKAGEKFQDTQALTEMQKTGALQDTTQLEQTLAATVEVPVDEDLTLSNSSRQVTIGQNAAGGFLPSPDEEDSSAERTPPQQQTRTTVNVTIELQ